MTYGPEEITRQVRWQRWQDSQDTRILDEMVASYELMICRYVARLGMLRSHPNYGDMMQSGRLAVIRALELYNPKSGLHMSTYVGHSLWSSLKTARLRSQQQFAGHVPVGMLNRWAKIQKARQALGNLDIPATPENIAVRTGFSVASIESTMASCLGMIPFFSLDSPWSSNGHNSAVRPEIPDSTNDPSKLVGGDAAQVFEMADRLPGRGRTIVQRWASGDTLEAIAEQFGVSKQRITQLLVRSLDQIRMWVGEPPTGRMAAAA